MIHKVRAIDLRRRMFLHDENAAIVNIERGAAYTYATLPSGRKVRYPHQARVWVSA